MMMPRRVRRERILLRSDSEARVELAVRLHSDYDDVFGLADPEPSDALPSQRRMLVGPEGRWLAYSLGRGPLHLRGPEGRELVVLDGNGRDVRFSPDGERLAAVTGPDDEHLELTIVDLGSGTQCALGAIPHARWIEWGEGGVVALVADGGAVAARTLLWLPLHGAPRSLAVAEQPIERVLTAGRRVVWMGGGEAFIVDIAGGDGASGEPRSLGPIAGEVTNAEPARDGLTAAFSTAQGLGLIDLRGAGNAPRMVDSLPGIHSVWFTDDGRLLYASPRTARVRDGEHVHELPLEAGAPRAISTLRPRHDSRLLTLVRDGHALTWDADADTLSPLSVEAGLISADVWQGGTVMWTLEPSTI